MKVLIVVDMQNDFIDGSLGTKEAVGNCYRDHGYGRFHENDGRFENWQKSCKGKGQRKQEQE